jgi:PAS domain S-box-containing protein
MQLLSTLVQNLPDYAIFLVDPAGIIVEWTQGAEHVKGYTAEEVLGQYFSLLYTPEDRAARLPDRILAEAGRSGRYENEGWRLRKGGERFWANEIATAVHDETGALIGFTKICRDLTERRQAEAALAESEERYRLIVEHATDYAIFTADAERRIETWPSGASAVYGWTAEEAIGQLIDITYTPEDQAAGIPAQEVAAARENRAAPNVRWHRRKDGHQIFIEGMTYVRLDEDGVFKVGQDVTARLLTEEARRADEVRLREELEAKVAAATMELRTLSHRLFMVQEEERRRLALELHDEIGQVLTGLNFQLAAATGPGGEAALAEAQSAVQTLTEQVRQLSLELRPAVLDRYGLLAAVQWYVERYQATTGISIHLLDEGLPERFTPAIEIAAFRVVQEALTNIARYAGVTEAWVTMVHDGSLLIVIHDQGCGFDPAHVAESNGLAGMRERIHLLGGGFDLDAAPGAGVRISAEFPLESRPPGAPEVPGIAGAAPGPARETVR